MSNGCADQANKFYTISYISTDGFSIPMGAYVVKDPLSSQYKVYGYVYINPEHGWLQEDPNMHISDREPDQTVLKHLSVHQFLACYDLIRAATDLDLSIFEHTVTNHNVPDLGPNIMHMDGRQGGDLEKIEFSVRPVTETEIEEIRKRIVTNS